MAAEIVAAEVPRSLRARARLLSFESMGQRLGQAGKEIQAAMAEAAGDPTTESWVWVHLAWHHIVSGRPQEALSAALRAADMAAASDAAEPEARALQAAGSAQRRLGLDRSETRARATRLLDRADVGAAAWGLYIEEGLFLLDEDRLVPARDMFSRAMASMAEDPGLFSESSDPLRFLAKAELRLGHCEAALALAARVRQMEPEHNVSLGLFAEAELAGGSLARAEAFAEEAVAASERVGDFGSVVWYWRLLGLCRLLAADAAGAVVFLRRADGDSKQGLTRWTRLVRSDLVEALARVGELAEARTLLTELTARTDQLPSRSTVAGTDRAHAILLLAEGQPDAAADLLAQVLHAQEELGLPLEAVRTLLAAAEVERRRRRRAAARALLERARKTCLLTRALPWLERVDAELVRSGGRSPRGGEEMLAPMEERIVAMVLQGATNREVATALSIGLSTVEGSLSHIYRKLGVRSRVELVRTATPSRTGRHGVTCVGGRESVVATTKETHAVWVGPQPALPRPPPAPVPGDRSLLADRVAGSQADDSCRPISG